MGFSAIDFAFATTFKMARFVKFVGYMSAKSLIPGSEQALEIYDLAIPLPHAHQQDKEFFHVLVLSSSDLEPPASSMARIERLYHQTGGRQVGIVFLLEEQSQNSNGTISFMHLQARYMQYFRFVVSQLAC